jgi:broad specificity phosphatase PhoE
MGSVDDAPGVEPQATVLDRAVAGLTDIARRHRGATVVVVSHDAVNRQVLAAFRPELGEPDTLPQDNGCFNTLEWQDGTWVVLDVNEIPPGCEGQPDRLAAARQASRNESLRQTRHRRH